jgi:hypothetical protein
MSRPIVDYKSSASAGIYPYNLIFVIVVSDLSEEDKDQ